MERAKQVELLRQCLDLTRDKRPFLSDEEALIPVADYVDEARFIAEREGIFRRAVNVVAHASEVSKPGDFITRDIVGTPAIIVRGLDGLVRAFINVCRHRGATVELRDRGHCRRFVCPYHGWAYETDGALAVARHPEGFPTLDVAATRLVRLPCFEAAGLVWVCPVPGGASEEPDAATRKVVTELEELGCGNSVVFASTSHVWTANWKLLVDGGLEAYHFRIAHRKTIAEFFPDNTSTYEFIGDHVRSILPRKSILELAAEPPEVWRLRDHTHVLYAIAPGAVVLLQKSHYDLLLLTPLSPEQTRIDLMTVVPDPGPGGHSESAAGFWAANHAFTQRTLDEDFVLGEQIQRGLRTGANEFFRFARFEGALKEWHRRLDEKLRRMSA